MQEPKGKGGFGEHLVQMAPGQIIYIKSASKLRVSGGKARKGKTRAEASREWPGAAPSTELPAASPLSGPLEPTGRI